eukprot:jgi/Mesvir1/7041/Mv26570-RA.1
MLDIWRKRETGEQQISRQLFQRAVATDPDVVRRFALDSKLKEHTGCVNHLSFNHNGNLLVSGSDDTTVCIWDVQRRKLQASYETGHSANIFCTRFLPGTNDTAVATCAGDGEVRVSYLDASRPMFVCRCHYGRVKKLVVEPGNPHLVISAAEDCTVRSIDLRAPHASCNASAWREGEGANVLVDLRPGPTRVRINSLSLSRGNPHHLVVAGGDPFVRVYDRRMLTAASSHSDSRHCCLRRFSPLGVADNFAGDGITGVSFSGDGARVAASYSSDAVFVFSMNDSLDR